MGSRARRRARTAATASIRKDFVALTEADLTYADRTDRVRDEIRELLPGDWQDRWLWIRDITDTWAVYEDDGNTDTPGCFRVGYTIDDAGDVTIVGPAVPVQAQTIYVPEAPESDDVPLQIETPAGGGDMGMGMMGESTRHLVGDTVPLVEKALRGDGTMAVKVIAPGWGSSGYYPADVLEANAASAFPAGTHMFWNHPSATEAVDRPERDLSDLAAVLASDAYWQENGPTGPGIYADAKVFGTYQPVLEELAPHIGVSIRAEGKAHLGEAEGKSGLIIDEIVGAHSVDYVTVPGAGGEVLSLFESARGRHVNPAPVPSPVPTPIKENAVQLQEALNQVTTLTTQLTEARQLGDLAAAERDQLRTENARLLEGQLLREARDTVTGALADAKYARLPAMTRERLVESLSATPPLKDGKLDTDTLTTRVEEAVKAEVAYLATVTGRGDGTVSGLGGGDLDLSESGTADGDAAAKKLDDAFAELGLEESARKIAVAGR